MFSMYFGGYQEGLPGNSIWLGDYDYSFLKKYVAGAADFSNKTLDSLVTWIDLNPKASIWALDALSLNTGNTELTQNLLVQLDSKQTHSYLPQKVFDNIKKSLASRTTTQWNKNGDLHFNCVPAKVDKQFPAFVFSL